MTDSSTYPLKLGAATEEIDREAKVALASLQTRACRPEPRHGGRRFEDG
jgi:hypothetical protein